MKKESWLGIASILLFIIILVMYFYIFFLNYRYTIIILIYCSLIFLLFLFSFSLFFGEYGWHKVIGKIILVAFLVITMILSFIFLQEFVTLFRIIVLFILGIISFFLIYKIIKFQKLENNTLKIIFKIIGIILVIATIILLISLIFINLYTTSQAKKAVQFEIDNLYLNIKCLEFCPYQQVYLEEKNYTTGNIEGNYRKVINIECTRVCDKENLKTHNILNKSDLFYSYISEKYNDKFDEEIKLIDGKCIRDLQSGDKSCLANWLDNLGKYSNAQFVEPVYENVALEIENLSCSDNGIDIVLNLKEGNIEGIRFAIRSSYGDTKSIEKMGDFSGVKEFVISKDEYEKYGENVSMVQIAYIKEGDISPIVSSKDC